MDYNMEDAVLLTEDATIFIDTETISEEELLEGDMSPEARGEEIP